MEDIEEVIDCKWLSLRYAADFKDLSDARRRFEGLTQQKNGVYQNVHSVFLAFLVIADNVADVDVTASVTSANS